MVKFIHTGGGTCLGEPHGWDKQSDDMYDGDLNGEHITIIILSNPHIHIRMPQEIDIDLEGDLDSKPTRKRMDELYGLRCPKCSYVYHSKDGEIKIATIGKIYECGICDNTSEELFDTCQECGHEEIIQTYKYMCTICGHEWQTIKEDLEHRYFRE